MHHNVIYGAIPTSWTEVLSDSTIIGDHFLVADLCFASKSSRIQFQESEGCMTCNGFSESHFPISYLSQRLSVFSNCIVKCSDVSLSVLNHVVNLAPDERTPISKFLPSENAQKMMLLAFEVIILGNSFAQVRRDIIF